MISKLYDRKRSESIIKILKRVRLRLFINLFKVLKYYGY